MRQRAAPGHRQPAERHRKDNRKERSEPEVRHGNADKRERGRHVVDMRSRADGREDPQRNRKKDGNDHRCRCQLNRRRQTLGYRCGDRLIRAERDTEIALRQPLEKAAVLHVQRSIEAEPAAQIRDVARRGAVSEHRLDRIARHQMNEREHEGRHAQENGNRQEKASRQEMDHAPLTIDYAVSTTGQS